MTEPSPDDADLREWFWRCALNLQTAAIRSTPQIAHPCDADHFADDAMRRIDALTEKRVAAAVAEHDKAALEIIRAAKKHEDAAIEAERQRCFAWALGRVPRSRACQAIRNGDDPHAGYLAKDPSLCWRCGETLHPGHDCSASADRPAPEGAAPTADLARPRCSTPSQEDTGSVSGEHPPIPTGHNRQWLRCRKCRRVQYYDYVPFSLSNPVMTTACGHGAGERDLGCDPIEPPNVTGGPGSASNTDAAQERRIYCGTCTTPNQCKMGRCQKAESSPTQTVAAPGPTARDMERARSVMNEADHQIETWKDVPGVVVGRSTYINTIAAALSAERAELLAQIREPSDELVEAVAVADWEAWRRLDIAADSCRDLPWDKLLELAELEAGRPARQIRDAARTQTRVCLRAIYDKLTEAK